MNEQQKQRFAVELATARAAVAEQSWAKAARALARAHALAERDPWPHVRVHVAMLRLEVARRQPRGMLWQGFLVVNATFSSYYFRVFRVPQRALLGNRNLHREVEEG